MLPRFRATSMPYVKNRIEHLIVGLLYHSLKLDRKVLSVEPYNTSCASPASFARLAFNIDNEDNLGICA